MTSASSDSVNMAAATLQAELASVYHAAALRTAVVCGIADHLSGGPLGVAELARLSGTDRRALYRVLRLLASRGIFHEDERGRFQLTPPAELLRTDTPNSHAAIVMMLTDEVHWRPAEHLEGTVRTGAPSFPTVFGAPFFEYLQSNPRAAEVFDRGMAAISAPNDRVVVQNYEFPAAGTVIELGGGRGGLLREILSRNPELSGILFDREWVLGQHYLDSEELTGRWRVEVGDFFAGVPAGGDLYILKNVLHDWPDEDCSRILGHCREAMRPSSRLLIVEFIIPPGNEPHPGKLVDVILMAATHGRERTVEEFSGLLGKANFSISRVLPLPSFASVIEARPKD